MKKLFLTSSILFCFVSWCKAQTAVFTISADSTCNIEIMKPIDGAYQSRYVYDEFQTTTGTPIQRTINLNEYSFFQIKFDQFAYFVLAFPGDSIAIHFANNTRFPNGNLPPDYIERLYTISGANASGHQYYNSQWGSIGNYIEQLRMSVMNTDNYSNYNEQFVTEFAEPSRIAIDSMVSARVVTPEFGKALTQEIANLQYQELLKTLPNISLNKKLTTQQTAQIKSIIDQITKQFVCNKNEYGILQLRSGIDYFYYNSLRQYRQLSEVQKKELHSNHKEGAFGPYTHLLLTPKQAQLACLFHVILLDYVYGNMGFEPIDIPYVVDYMRTLAPNSEAVSILTKMEQAQSNKKIDTASIKYMEGPINSFAELMAHPDLKGNYCLIDLWATWCMPCLMEHKHAEALHKAVSDFKNLKQVYITIDEPKDEKRWKALIEKFNLSGLHLMATPELQKEIQVKIFKGEDISIPRYILLSPSGEVINPELPRPSELGELKKVLTGSVGLVI